MVSLKAGCLVSVCFFGAFTHALVELVQLPLLEPLLLCGHLDFEAVLQPLVCRITKDVPHVLSGDCMHALVELVQLSLGALKQCGGGGGGGAEIHWSKAEHGRARCVNDNIGWCCDTDGSHGGGREEKVYRMLVW
jgi:hypothetical protein